MSLDDAAKMQATQRLYQEHPELNGQPLHSGRKYDKYRLEWARLYREALAQQPKVITTRNSLANKMTTKCEKCPRAIESDCCLKAQKDPELKKIVDKVKRMRTLAAHSHNLPGTVWALDHFLDGSGQFVEIPPGKVEFMQKHTESSHRQQFLGKMKNRFGANTMLARQLVDNEGHAKPNKDWPRDVSFTMDFMSGDENVASFDDKLTYYGSTIYSTVQIRCKHLDERNYMCSVTSWLSYVVDNYDWEGEKTFSNPFMDLPSQMDMNRLNTSGCAKSYQRSSKSWQNHDKIEPWIVGFTDANNVERLANYRLTKIIEGAQENEKERRDGALPIPAPAEEVANKTIAPECPNVHMDIRDK